MKIMINRKPVTGPWGGGNHFIKALHEYAYQHGFEPINKLEENIDLIFMIDPRYDELGISINEINAYKNTFPQVRIVYRVNECDARKGINNEVDNLIRSCSNISDVCFFISKWIHDYHVKDGWGCDRNPVIYSGTNKEYFQPREKIKNLKTNIVTHHWSDNPLKGHDIYQQLDEWIKDHPDFTFTYIGRSHGELKNTRMISPTFGLDLGKKLSQYDVYISASRFDPGPNHIIESVACGIPTYAHVDSGGGIELVGNDHVYSGFDNLKNILLSGDHNLNRGYQPTDWETCIKSYFSYILELF